MQRLSLEGGNTEWPHSGSPNRMAGARSAALGYGGGQQLHGSGVAFHSCVIARLAGTRVLGGGGRSILEPAMTADFAYSAELTSGRRTDTCADTLIQIA